MKSKIWWLSVALLTAMFYAVSPSQTPPKQVMLDIPLKLQETMVWCWAASAEMILGHFGLTVPQCQQANENFQREDCCNDNRSWRCVDISWPSFYRYGFESDSLDGAISWQQLKGEIDAGRPVAFSWEWTDGGGHMMVAVGYQEPNTVFVNDPWDYEGFGDTRDPDLWKGDLMVISYDEYVKGSDHAHYRDYFNIRPKREPEAEMTERQESPTESHAAVASREPLVQVEPETEPATETANGSGTGEQEGGSFQTFEHPPRPKGGYGAIQEALVYPRTEAEHRIGGTVMLNVLIAETGEVAAANVLSSSGNENLDNAAIQAVKKVQWQPAMQRDAAVKAWVAVPVRFIPR